MPKEITALLADLQSVVQQMKDANGKQEGQAVESQTGTPEPDPAPAAENDVAIKADGLAAGVAIGVDVDKNNPMKLERIEVAPEPDGSFRIMIRAKRE